MGFENGKNYKKMSNSDKVIASLVLAGVGAAATPLAIEKFNTGRHEYISEGALDLGEELNKKFGTKLQVESENGQYILHLGQIHGVNRMSEEWKEKVVTQQKDLEDLILELKERYGVNVVFDEGNYLDHQSPEISLESFHQVYKDFGHSSYIDNVLIPNLDKIENKLPEFISDDFESIDELGLTSPQIKRRVYLNDYQVLETFENLLKFVVSDESLSADDVTKCKELLVRIEDIKKSANLMPGFSDLNYLVGGATEKLDRENKIKEMPAETTGAIANPPKSRFQTFGKGGEFHERREDVSSLIAYEFALNNPEAKYVPMVYGHAHDFANNIKAINEMQSDSKYKIGLIRIDYKK